jgi:hypothetical protein
METVNAMVPAVSGTNDKRMAKTAKSQKERKDDRFTFPNTYGKRGALSSALRARKPHFPMLISGMTSAQGQAAKLTSPPDIAIL